ncbi:hypothetical protein FRC03_012564 [Tulasnella sp. 419]|nr:hypothetical protein FRC03_012564 [Tulasnella sp. 419]
MASLPRYKLIFFSPVNATQNILSQLFSASKDGMRIGQIGAYDRCAFACRGTGQFKPLENANPTIGSVGQVEFVEEDKVEVAVQGDVKAAVAELRKVHPYEEPAYEVYQMVDV